MAMKVEIYQKDNVKPFFPTPQSSRSYKLSVLDQIASTFYIPMVLFYDFGSSSSSRSSSHRRDYDDLKESLSRTMSVLPPLAGRLKDDGLSIECNDEGADFVQANVTNYDLADVIRHPKLYILRQLLACDPYPMGFDPAQPLLTVQANRFRCSGMAVGICVWHAVLDGAGLVGFYQTWAAINRGEVTSSLGNGLIVDPTSIFPPMKIQISKFISSAADERKRNWEKYYTKRFVFSKQEIENMREAYKQQSNHRRPTRVETLSAFIWAAVIRATLRANQSLKGHLLTNVVDLRKRMNPPFPLTCLGNINQFSIAKWEAKHGIVVTAQSLIGSVGEAIRELTDDYVKKMHQGGGYIKTLIIKKTQAANDNNGIKILSISSWCNFPFSTIDFGWGKPILVCPVLHLEELALFLDTNDGGIEVWLGLSRELMCNLDNDNKFFAHVLYSQVVSEEPELITRRIAE